jgi:hypothetical protein
LGDRYAQYPWEEEVGRGEDVGGGDGGVLGGGGIGWLVAGAAVVVVVGVVLGVFLCFPE